MTACLNRVCVGSDHLIEAESKVSTFDDCKQNCKDDSGCNVITYNPENRVCRLYSDCGTWTDSHNNCSTKSWEKLPLGSGEELPLALGSGKELPLGSGEET